MFPLLQPNRPQVQQPRSPPTIPHQQVRAVQVHPQPSTTFQSPRQPPISLNSSSSSSFTSPTPQRKPISQVDAMPPVPPLLPFSPSLYPTLLHSSSPRSLLYDSSTRHPVFFTQTLRKPPFPVRDGGVEGFSPVAFGYVVERRRDEEGLGVRGRL